MEKEYYRKLIHICSLLIPLTYKYILNYNAKIAIIIISVLAVIFILVDIYRLKENKLKEIFSNIFDGLLRTHEKNDFTGATYLMFSSVICIAFLQKDIAFVAMSFLSIGDTAAALIGKKFGKRKFKTSKKTLEGFLACFIICFAYALFFLKDLNLSNTSLIMMSLCGSLAASFSELLEMKIDDNIKIPVISGFFMFLFFLICY